MITEKQHAKIRLLSDTELYPQAITFMRGIARTLPATQINGLLNVSLGSTYDQLLVFIAHQSGRTTWRRGEQHIPLFYKELKKKLEELGQYIPSIVKLGAEKPSLEDEQALKMELARAFIQHLLAENGYMEAMRSANNAKTALR